MIFLRWKHGHLIGDSRGGGNTVEAGQGGPGVTTPHLPAHTRNFGKDMIDTVYFQEM